MWPFCQGDPGSMNVVDALLNRHQSAMAKAANSGHEFVEHVHQIISGDGPLDVHRQAFAGEDVLNSVGS
jgi:hypothetical protein